MQEPVSFKHVSYLWHQVQAAKLTSEVDLLIYRSNLLGADLRLTNYGGGNTSCKVMEEDPLTGNEVPVLWVKGSGGDLGTLRKDGLSALLMDRVLGLEKIYKGIGEEDKMVGLYDYCLYDIHSRAPSIDTPLHAFLPFKHIDHLHPDAAIAIAAAKDGEQITRELFGGSIGWVNWQRPGFDLGLKMRKCLVDNPGIRGIILGSHGLFTWGDTAYSCYLNTLEIIEKCAAFVEQQVEKKGQVFGGAETKSLAQEERQKKVQAIAPVLRGLCSSGTNEKISMVGHYCDLDAVMEFVNSRDLRRLSAMGTSCPDHFLRTKIAPLVLDLDQQENLTDAVAVRKKIEPLFEEYRAMYAEYYESCKKPDSPAMRNPNPVIILWPGVGLFSFAKDKSTARIAAEFYTNAITVMRGSEAVSAYTSLPRQEAFNIEYWLLEEAKLQRMPAPRPLNGRIALITGSGGGIGKAIAAKFALEGACVLINDRDASRVEETLLDFQKRFGKDRVRGIVLDVTDAMSVEKAFEYISIEFGGVDILVNNAGISISKPIGEHSVEEWDRLYDILVRGQFLISKTGVAIMKKQALGGDIVNIVSKNAVVSGPDNSGYGSAKAAQAHLSRLLAAELGVDGIRVNSINPDAVIADSNIWAGGWAAGRAKAYGISIEELPAFYARRTLLNTVIIPEDIANAAFAFVSGLLSKSTGNSLNVDGGLPAAFLR